MIELEGGEEVVLVEDEATGDEVVLVEESSTGDGEAAPAGDNAATEDGAEG